ncbi:MAG: hypothetical protein L7U72_07120, partial [Rubripirellula sp.]|nr:hypothetical protein [Rubripirellula sp.]
MTPHLFGHAASCCNGATRAVVKAWRLCAFCLLANLMFGATSGNTTAQNWAQWRGRENRGFTDANPPISW